jgi:hypothetical protein
MPRTDVDAVAYVWGTHRRLSHAATAVKRSITRWRTVSLVLAAVGAVAATLATQLGLDSLPGRLVGGAGGAALAFVPIIHAAKLGRDRLDVWTRARLASERLKSECHLYLAGAAPYDGDDPGAVLSRRTEEVLDDVPDVAGDLGPDGSAAPDVADAESYLRLRLHEQVGFYDRRAARQQVLLKRFRAFEFTLSLGGALLAVVAAVSGVASVGVWVAVVTTVAGAVTAHVGAARYQFLALSYRAAARRLRSLEHAWRAGTGANTLVRDCEEAIARQNDSWMAGWMREGPARGADVPRPRTQRPS